MWNVIGGGKEDTFDGIGDCVGGSRIWPNDVKISQFFGAKRVRKL